MPQAELCLVTGAAGFIGSHLCERLLRDGYRVIGLACLYAANFQVPTVSLRYFTVYGPRQRPDMAFHAFLRAIYAGEPVLIYGDGEQTRDFTYISDVVQANILAMTRGEVGAAYNIGGGSRVTVNRCLEVLRQVTCQELRVIHQESQYGEMRHTYADISAAQQVLGYEPRVTLEEGLAAEDAWFREVILAGPRPGSGAGTAARMQKNG